MSADAIIPFVGNYAKVTTATPFSLVLLGTMIVFMLALPRKYALMPLLIVACFIPYSQRIVVMGLDFTFTRLIVLAGIIRVVLRSENRTVRYNQTDALVLGLALAQLVIYMLRTQTASGIQYQMGIIFETLGVYYLFRCMLSDLESLHRFIGFMAVLCILDLFPFLVEKLTRYNIFSIFGGVPQLTEMREGKLRCQGAFEHPIIAGCFWAAVLPLFFAAAIAARGRSRVIFVFASVSALVLVFLTASSTPVMGVLFALVALTLFFLRRSFRTVKVLAFFGLVGMQLLMKSPIYSVLAHIDLIGGSTGWHRYALIDASIHQFSQWWLLGVASTATWGIGLFDVTNQFVLVAVQGGLLALCLFVFTLRSTFRGVGMAWRWAIDRRSSFLMWAIGASLFCHVMSFFAVSYFGQIVTLWYGTLALCAAIRIPSFLEGDGRIPPEAPAHSLKGSFLVIRRKNQA